MPVGVPANCARLGSDGKRRVAETKTQHAERLSLPGASCFILVPFIAKAGEHGTKRKRKEVPEKAHCEAVEKHLTVLDFIRERRVVVSWADRHRGQGPERARRPDWEGDSERE